jgi:hypothetical protein
VLQGKFDEFTKPQYDLERYNQYAYHQKNAKTVPEKMPKMQYDCFGSGS